MVNKQRVVTLLFWVKFLHLRRHHTRAGRACVLLQHTRAAMVQGDTNDMVRGMPASMTNLYHEDYRTHDEYQYKIKDKVRARLADDNEKKMFDG